MSTLAVWLAYKLPWWVFALGALVATLGIARVVGLRAGALAAAFLAVLVAHRKGAQDGYSAREAQGEEDARHAIAAAARARSAAERSGSDARGLREDDGFRRD